MNSEETLKEVAMAFIEFLISPAGRVLRIAAGLAIVLVGFIMQGTAGVVVSIVGLVPIVTGAMNLCLIGPLFGADLRGQPRPPRSPGTAAR